MMDMRTMALETFLPWTSLLRMRFDMKYSTDTNFRFDVLNYTKQLALKRILIIVALIISISHTFSQNSIELLRDGNGIIVAAQRTEAYLPMLEGKRVAVVGNQTSLIKQTHLVDSLLSLKVNLIRVFSPEHGFRGLADAGAKVENETDSKTGLPIISLYGKNKKPTSEQLKGLDLILFDLQDVGVRFYTYISTLHYVMEAAAENNVEVIVLDRPNPNGFIVDGPVLQKGFESFVGMHPVPVIYGMTIGEYAQMINGESWLNDGLQCKLTVVKLVNYTHAKIYSLPIAPSPNLQNDNAVNLYPSLCLFEGTVVSIGRGTEWPFEIYGHPNFEKSDFTFTPRPGKGSADPKLNGKLCFGIDLRGQKTLLNKFDLSYLLYANRVLNGTNWIDNPKFFNLLAGNNVLIEQLKANKSEEEIRASWREDLDSFRLTREKYLLYE